MKKDRLLQAAYQFARKRGRWGHEGCLQFAEEYVAYASSERFLSLPLFYAVCGLG